MVLPRMVGHLDQVQGDFPFNLKTYKGCEMTSLDVHSLGAHVAGGFKGAMAMTNQHCASTEMKLT